MAVFGRDNRGGDERPAMPPAPPQQSGSGKRGMFSVVGSDMIVTGSITATADLHIDGRIDGDVICVTLAQGAESKIVGSATADAARIAGAIEGDVRVKQLTVERSAKITGDVEYEHITIEHGGGIDGRLKHMSIVAAAAPVAKPSMPTDPHSVDSTPSRFGNGADTESANN